MTTTSAEHSSSNVPRPPFDRELAQVLEGMASAIPRLSSVDQIAGLRRGVLTSYAISDEDLTCNGYFDVTEQLIPGPHGAPDVPVTICRPSARPKQNPVFLYIHGGGMVVPGNRIGMLGHALSWAQEYAATVVSVEYRVAPEAPYPGPVEDCYAALQWTADHAGDLDIDIDRIIICGVSGGGGLAAATTLICRDRHGPSLAGQILICPMLDDRNETVSARQFDGVGVWDRRTNMTAWEAFLGPEPRGAVSQYAAPARNENFADLPPTFIDVGSAEVFRDEAVSYASRILAAGGEAELHVWAGGFHGYDGMAPDSEVAEQTRSARMGWLQRQLGNRQATDSAPIS